jgi:hypothetical protein
MNYGSILGTAILTAVFLVPESKGQSYAAESVPRPTLLAPAVKIPEIKTESTAPISVKKDNDPRTLSAARFHKTQFLILSAAVYGASLADMHQTLPGKKIFLMVRNRSAGKTSCKAARARLLRHRPGSGH